LRLVDRAVYTYLNMTHQRPFLAALAAMSVTFSLHAEAVPHAPKMPTQAAFRFLRQASWGPTTATVAHLQQVGFKTYLQEQFAAPLSPIPDAQKDANGNQLIGPVQQQFFLNAVNGEDQLRQRVMFALNQIWVVSFIKINIPQAMIVYLRTLQKDALANYYDVMYDITLNPAMGHYLDMVNNDKGNPATGHSPNENYAREIMQLFSIGVSELNPDGTLKLDTASQPIPAYTQDTIEGFASLFTGWTYAPLPGKNPASHNPASWTSPMVAVEANHESTYSKTLLNGVTLPAGQSAEKDLDQGLQNIFQHPNVGPFICKQLIQHFVSSNPSSYYVQRVASVFADNGQGVRGDMKAVMEAILLDEEARRGDDGTLDSIEGHLTEPVLFFNALLRELNAKVVLNNGLAAQGNALAQNIYYPPTVFNYFAPSYAIGDTGVNAPEFQLLSSATAMLRANFVNGLIYGTMGGVTLDLTPYQNLAGNPSQMLDAMNKALLGGTMSPAMRGAIMTAVNAATTPKAKAQAALYLIASSWQYQVER
jgi:uncharacterized protein (DUF1800 family)